MTSIPTYVCMHGTAQRQCRSHLLSIIHVSFELIEQLPVDYLCS